MRLNLTESSVRLRSRGGEAEEGIGAWRCGNEGLGEKGEKTIRKLWPRSRHERNSDPSRGELCASSGSRNKPSALS